MRTGGELKGERMLPGALLDGAERGVSGVGSAGRGSEASFGGLGAVRATGGQFVETEIAARNASAAPGCPASAARRWTAGGYGGS